MAAGENQPQPVVSMALNRAVEISQGRGLAGMPVLGQSPRAAANASIFGTIEITEQANQSRENPSRIHPVQHFDRLAYLFQNTRGHALESSKPALARTIARAL